MGLVSFSVGKGRSEPSLCLPLSLPREDTVRWHSAASKEKRLSMNLPCWNLDLGLFRLKNSEK